MSEASEPISSIAIQIDGNTFKVTWTNTVPATQARARALAVIDAFLPAAEASDNEENGDED